MPIRTFQLHTSLRVLSVLSTLMLASNFTSSALLVLNEPNSMVSKIAGLSLSAVVLAYAWIFASIALAPYVVMQIFAPDFGHRRFIVKVANFSLIAGSMTWFFLAFMARNLDYKFVVWIYIANGFAALVMAAVLANGLNDEQKQKADT